MNPQDAEEYTQGLGQIGGGLWRQMALGIRLGAHEALGLTREQWVDRIGGHIKLSIPERREAVTELKADGHSNREIADVLGVDERSVRRDQAAATAAEPDQNDNENNDNKINGAANAAPEFPAPYSKPPDLEFADPIEEPCEDCDTIADHWHRSLENIAGDALSLRSYWTRQFGQQWQQADVPLSLVKLARQAAKEWTEIARDLEKRRKGVA